VASSFIPVDAVPYGRGDRYEERHKKAEPAVLDGVSALVDADVPAGLLLLKEERTHAAAAPVRPYLEIPAPSETLRMFSRQAQHGGRQAARQRRGQSPGKGQQVKCSFIQPYVFHSLRDAVEQHSRHVHAAGGRVGQRMGDPRAVADDEQAGKRGLQIAVELHFHVVELDFHAVQ